MNYQKINPQTGERYHDDDGRRVTRTKLPASIIPTETSRWVPIIPRPTDAPDEGKKWMPFVDLESWQDTWQQVDMTEEELTALEPKIDPLSIWWDGLTVSDKALLYQHADNAILAWDRAKASGEEEDMQVVFTLIQGNNAPEIADIKDGLMALLAGS